MATQGHFVDMGNIPGIEYRALPGFEPDFSNWSYKQQFANRMNDRLQFIRSRETEKGGMDALPPDALQAVEKVIAAI